MTDAISSAQLAMNIDKSALDEVSHNIANLHTTGYRKQFMLVPEFEQLVNTNQREVQTNISTVPLQRQGTLDKTGRLLDFAISGEGFFTIETENGIRYTRRGDFHLNPQGELETFDGQRVILDGAALSLENEQVRVTADGTIYQNNKPVGKLRLTNFLPETKLQASGHGYFIADEGENKTDAVCHIQQGFLEQSNVKTVDEMMDMVRISRHFETSQRLMRLSDDLLGKAISQLGEG